LLETIVGIAASCFKVPSESLGEFSSPADTEVWDSLAHLGLVAAVEEHFSIHLSTAEIMQIENLSDLVEIVSAKRCRDL
jgi:acyl carrier protein